jgi:hypothetical protein
MYKSPPEKKPKAASSFQFASLIIKGKTKIPESSAVAFCLCSIGSGIGRTRFITAGAYE